jgi:hypothetical protein
MATKKGTTGAPLGVVARRLSKRLWSLCCPASCYERILLRSCSTRSCFGGLYSRSSSELATTDTLQRQKAGRQAGRQAGGQAGRQAGGRAGGQAGRQTNMTTVNRQDGRHASEAYWCAWGFGSSLLMLL